MENERKLGHYIEQHLSQIDVLLEPRRSMWTKFIDLYKARRTNPDKNFPWPGCSNIFVPELFDRVSTAAAHIYGTTIRNDPPFLVRSEYGTEEDTKLAEDLEHFIRYYIRTVQKQDAYWRVHLPYLILLGTHVVKVQAVDVSPQGYPLIRLDPVSLHRFYTYPSITKWWDAPILADLSWVSPGTVAQWVKDGNTTDEKAEAVLTQVNDPLAKIDTSRASNEMVPGGYVPIHDVYVRWQQDVLSIPKLIRAIFHRETGTVLWTEDWTWRPLPYQLIYWRRDEESVFGIGVGDTIWTVQEAMNTIINQVIDNMTVANIRAFAAPPGAGIEPGESIYPGKVFVGVNVDKIKEVRLGDVYPSAIAIPQIIRQIMERNSAFNDTFMGMSDAVQKSRFTFAGAALNVQQGSMRVDYNSAEFEDGLVSLVWATLDALVKYNSGDEVMVPVKKRRPSVILKELLEETPMATDLASLLRAPLTEQEAMNVETTMFRIPSVILRRERFSIRPARREANAQVERQAAIVLSQIIAQYLRNILQLAQAAGDPELVKKTVPEIWRVANYAMRKILIAFAVEESSEMIVDFAEVMNVLNTALSSPVLGVETAEGMGGGQPAPEQPGMGIDQGTGPAGLAGAPGGFLGGSF